MIQYSSYYFKLSFKKTINVEHSVGRIDLTDTGSQISM